MAENTKPDNSAPQEEGLSEYEQIRLRGLFPVSADADAGIISWTGLRAYAPVIMSAWLLCFILLCFQPIPAFIQPATGLSLIFSGFALCAAFYLFRPVPGSGAWPANRTAAMLLLLVILDFWVWAFHSPYGRLAANIFVAIDAIGLTALLAGLYLYVYKGLHVFSLVKILLVKAFFDFACYVLSGGFGFQIFAALGIEHPLHIDALFTVAMLELWALLVYIIKYRPKIAALQPD